MHRVSRNRFKKAAGISTVSALYRDMDKSPGVQSTRRTGAIASENGRRQSCSALTSVHYRDWALPVLQAFRRPVSPHPEVVADSVYVGKRVANVISIVVGIVRGPGLRVLPRRWVVGRWFAWIDRNRRFAGTLRAPLLRQRYSSERHPSRY